jgi:hypothetical protein
MVFNTVLFGQIFRRIVLKKDILALIISLVITMIILNILKLPPIAGFILGSILWSILHYNLKKKL